MNRQTRRAQFSGRVVTVSVRQLTELQRAHKCLLAIVKEQRHVRFSEKTIEELGPGDSIGGNEDNGFVTLEYIDQNNVREIKVVQ